MFRHPRRTRGLHVYQREGRCRILIASHVVAVSVVDRVPRRKVIREYEGSGGTGGNKEEALERDKAENEKGDRRCRWFRGERE